MPDFDPSERLSLAEQLQVLISRGVPEAEAKERLSKAFRRGELNYQPNYSISYDDAYINCNTGQVILPRLPRQPFTPTSTAAEFFVRFPLSSAQPDSRKAGQAGRRDGEISKTAPETRTVWQPDSIPLMEAVHDLRIARSTDLRSAISEMIDLLATGQLPPANAIIDAVPATIDPECWVAGAIEYPNSRAAFKLIIDGEERLTRAREIRLDGAAWERRLARIVTARQVGAGCPPAMAAEGTPAEPRMAYLSPDEQERANWRTLPEVVVHVVRVDGCQTGEARRHISGALANGDLWPLRWEDSRPLLRGSTGGLMMPDDFPPREWAEAEIAEIDWEGGTAFTGPNTRPPEGQRRVLLIHLPALLHRWPDREAEQRAAEQSRAMRQAATARLFEEPVWHCALVLGWIAFRDPARIEHSWTAERLYGGAALRDRNPPATLLRALQEDRLRAFSNGRELPPEAWFDKKPHSQGWGVHFRRRDVFALWPAAADATSEDSASGAAPNAAAKPVSRGGRKKGSGSIDDTKRLRAMLRLLVTEKACSVHEAASEVAKSVIGHSPPPLSPGFVGNLRKPMA